MKLRVVGTSEREDSGYYLRDEFDMQTALEEGFGIRLGKDGYYYGDQKGRGGWTAREVVSERESSDNE